jgi:hypothetical protein
MVNVEKGPTMGVSLANDGSLSREQPAAVEIKCNRYCVILSRSRERTHALSYVAMTRDASNKAMNEPSERTGKFYAKRCAGTATRFRRLPVDEARTLFGISTST